MELQLSSIIASLFWGEKCAGGGTGLRVRLRGVWEQSRGGSSPLRHTNVKGTFAGAFYVCVPSE